MIKSEDGLVVIEGTEPQILAETMGVLDAVYQMLLQNHDEDHAKRRIESLGTLYVQHEEKKKHDVTLQN